MISSGGETCAPPRAPSIAALSLASPMWRTSSRGAEYRRPRRLGKPREGSASGAGTRALRRRRGRLRGQLLAHRRPGAPRLLHRALVLDGGDVPRIALEDHG